MPALSSWFATQDVQVQAVLDQGCYAPGSTVHGTLVLTCPAPVSVKNLDVAVHGYELVAFEEPARGWHDFIPGLHPPAYKHQAQRQLFSVSITLLPPGGTPSAYCASLNAGQHSYAFTWELPGSDAEGNTLPGTFACETARVFYYMDVRCWTKSSLSCRPDVRQCFQIHVCQLEHEPAWVAKRHVTKKCFTNVSTDYLLHAPAAGDVLFGIAMERLAWSPGACVSFDYVIESHSGVTYTCIQVTLVRTITTSAPRTNDLARIKRLLLGNSELERLRSAGLAPVPKRLFSARHWQVLCEAEEYEGRPAWVEQRRVSNTKQLRGALWKHVIALPQPVKGAPKFSSAHGRMCFMLPADLLAQQTVRTARITCCDHLAFTLLGSGLSPDQPELRLPFKVAYPLPAHAAAASRSGRLVPST